MADYAASSKPAIRRTMFHINSDRARFDKIAVLSGKRSTDLVSSSLPHRISPRQAQSHTALG
jgi:hypothetical protein